MGARVFFLTLGLFVFIGCALTDSLTGYTTSHPIEIDTDPTNYFDHFPADPELVDYLQELRVPQDNFWHFSGTGSKDVEVRTGKIGYTIEFSAKHSWEFFHPTPTPHPTPIIQKFNRFGNQKVTPFSKLSSKKD